LIRQQLEKERWIKNQIYLELQTLFSQYTELKEKITYYQEALQYAKENLNLSEKRYINGLGTYLELTNATTLYFNANKNYYDNIFLFYLKKLELYKAMGVLLELL
jgi:outer membrane protein TolC